MRSSDAEFQQLYLKAQVPYCYLVKISKFSHQPAVLRTTLLKELISDLSVPTLALIVTCEFVRRFVFQSAGVKILHLEAQGPSFPSTWTSKMPKRMDPVLPILSILGYWADVLGTWEVQVPSNCVYKS